MFKSFLAVSWLSSFLKFARKCEIHVSFWKQAQYQAENCAQLSSAVSPSTTQGAFPGPSTLRLFDEPDGEESWKEVAESLIYKVRAYSLLLATHFV